MGVKLIQVIIAGFVQEGILNNFNKIWEKTQRKQSQQLNYLFLVSHVYFLSLKIMGGKTAALSFMKELSISIFKN